MRRAEPSASECQRVLADQLAEEMKALGVSDVRVEDKCYVYGKIPATKGYEGKTKLGFIAHMDTVSDFADHAVNRSYMKIMTERI